MVILANTMCQPSVYPGSQTPEPPDCTYTSTTVYIFIFFTEDAKFDLLGKGVCRGSDWSSEKWPFAKGAHTLQECANACKRKLGCVSFDLTPLPEEHHHHHKGGDKHQCQLYGHSHPVPASGMVKV